MYLRLVHANIHPGNLAVLKQIYQEKVIPVLRATKGCISGSLIHSEHHPDECISMTLWKRKEDAEAYEREGAFQKLLEEAKPYLAGSSEWKLQLSEDFTVQYVPVQQEPLVKSYDLSENSPAGVLAASINSFYVRIVTPHVRPEAREEFVRLYNEEVLPAIQRVPGCRYVSLVENAQERNQFISMTVWNSKQDADTYEGSGLFQDLSSKLRHTFTEAFQWKMQLERATGRRTVSTEDMEVEGYSLVAGESFV